MIRAFDWRYFPTLHRNRDNGLCLDSRLALTRWMTRVPAGALLASFAPATGIFTFVGTNRENKGNPVIGQFTHILRSPYARMTFITPEAEIESADAAALLDHLASEAGSRGAHNLLAEVEEGSIAYEVIRRAGYAVYTRQRIWQLPNAESSHSQQLWRNSLPQDEHDLRSLYSALVPALVQQTEPPPWQNMEGLAYSQGEELLAYAHLTYGPKGLLIRPIVHHDTDPVGELLQQILSSTPHVRDRPVYICVRSHQAWLEPFLSEMGARSLPRQAVMVKRLVAAQKVSLPIKIPATGLETAQPEISNIIHSFRNEELNLKNYAKTKNY